VWIPAKRVNVADRQCLLLLSRSWTEHSLQLPQRVEDCVCACFQIPRHIGSHTPTLWDFSFGIVYAEGLSWMKITQHKYLKRTTFYLASMSLLKSTENMFLTKAYAKAWECLWFESFTSVGNNDCCPRFWHKKSPSQYPLVLYKRYFVTNTHTHTKSHNIELKTRFEWTTFWGFCF